MDTPSHGLWSYVIWHATPFPLLAVLFGMLPDLVSFLPATIYNLQSNKGWGALRNNDRHPGWLKKYTNAVFPVTHSLVVASAVSAVVFLVWGNQWWILAWPLHIIVDMVSHIGEKATPFLWPLSGYRVTGVDWTIRIAAINVLLIAGAWLYFLH